MDGQQIIEALKAYHNRKEWVCLEELRLSSGHGGVAEQRIDLFVINVYPSKSNHRIAYEVKVSNGDFLKEIRQPFKRNPALMLCNQFFFAAPKGIIKPAKVPRETGLVEVGEDGIVEIVVAAPVQDSFPPAWGTVASIARRVRNAEKQIQNLLHAIEELGEDLRKKKEEIKNIKQMRLFKEEQVNGRRIV